MWNQFTGIGNLAADPEVKEVGDTMVANFTVCCDYGYGEHKKTEFVRCVAWAKLAGIIQQYLFKGSKCFIQGTMETRSWETDSGEKKYSTEVRVDTMKMLDKKGEGPSSGGGQFQGGDQQELPGVDGEIPF